MKKAYIIHGWGANSQSDWIPWLKQKLLNRDYEVITPNMPNTNEPQINIWLSKLQEVLVDLNKDDIIIGHSIAGQAILRYLEKIDSSQIIPKVILVAPWFKLSQIEEEEKEIAEEWINTPINFEYIQKLNLNIISLFSNNDPFVPLENEVLFKNLLNSQTQIYEEKGHFNSETGIEKLPEILEFIN